MQTLKIQLRMLGFYLLILLAAVGVSLGAGIPVTPKKKDNDSEIKLELVDENTVSNSSVSKEETIDKIKR